MLHIGSNGDLAEVFRILFMYLKDKTFKYLKKPKLLWQFQVTFHIQLDIRRENDDEYDDEESSKENYNEQHDDEKHALIR